MRKNEPTGAPAISESLGAEADRFHSILFGGSAPEEIKRQYAAALQALPIAPMESLETLLESGADFEAMELALRKKNPFNPLTQRFRVLCYLVEPRPDYFHRFVGERRAFLAAAGAMFFAALRSIYLGIKGRYLVRKHGVG
jgi:hypothetical protein